MTNYKELRALCDAATDGECFVLSEITIYRNTSFKVLSVFENEKDAVIYVKDNLFPFDYWEKNNEGALCLSRNDDDVIIIYKIEKSKFIAATDPQTVRALIDEVERYRAALEFYADEKNWQQNDDGINRIWNEPDSSTPDAYHGYELAQQALKGTDNE